MAERDDRRPRPRIRRGAARGARRLRAGARSRSLYANRAAREAHGAPVVGDDDRRRARRRGSPPRSPPAGPRASSGPRGTRATSPRPAWRSRSSPATAAAPLVVLYELEPADSRSAAGRARARWSSDLEETGDELAEREAALALADEVVELLRDRPGVAAITASADLLLRRLDIVDVAVAPYMTGQIVLGPLLARPARPRHGHRRRAPAARRGRARRRDHRARSPPDAAALGAPEGLGALIVPAICAGEALARARAAVRRHARWSATGCCARCASSRTCSGSR